MRVSLSLSLCVFFVCVLEIVLPRKGLPGFLVTILCYCFYLSQFFSFFGQAHFCLSACDIDHGHGKKNLLFIKWKYLEAKVNNTSIVTFDIFLHSVNCTVLISFVLWDDQAAAYYYHGLILDKGTEPSCHISAVCCFLAAEELLSNSKKACLSFCLAAPVTRLVIHLCYM